jgi:hypothetical protein
MYNLEIVFGIGSEHAAGHAKFQSDQKLSSTDQANIKEAARAILSAVEGNYLALPGHITADIIDVAFSAGPVILEAIKFYGHLKAQVLNMQWMSLSLTGDAGSNASMFTSSNMWLTAFNAQMAGAAKVIGEQLATQLRRYNQGEFGSVKKLPVLKATPVEANIDLLELAQFVTAVFPVLDITAEDMAAVRRKSSFLPEIDIAEIVEDEDEPMSEPEPEPDDSVTDDMEPTEDDAAESAEFARPVAIGRNQPTVTDEDDLIDLDDPKDIERMIRRIERLDPLLGDLLRAEASDE